MNRKRQESKSVNLTVLIDLGLVSLFPTPVAKEFVVFPFRRLGAEFLIGTESPLEAPRVGELEKKLGGSVVALRIQEGGLAGRIEEFFSLTGSRPGGESQDWVENILSDSGLAGLKEAHFRLSVPYDVLHSVPASLARITRVLPIARGESELVVASPIFLETPVREERRSTPTRRWPPSFPKSFARSPCRRSI